MSGWTAEVADEEEKAYDEGKDKEEEDQREKTERRVDFLPSLKRCENTVINELINI